MRAGIIGFEELPYRDGNGEPIVGAMVPNLSPDLSFGQRLVEMLAMVIQDCIGQTPALPLQNVPLLVGVAETGRPGGAWLSESLIVRVQERLEWSFHPQLSQVIPRGHTAGFEGLKIARELIRNPEIPGCLVCGVDSYIHGGSLWWLQQDWRLKREDHSDGVIPGEAAAAVYVQRQPPSNAATLVEVIGLGAAHEKATVFSEEPLLGRALAEAARVALTEAKLEMHNIDFRLSDVTGESYGFKEQAIALSRLMRVRREELPLWHCAEFIGDCGATAGVAQLVFAYESFIKGYAPGDHAACYTSAVLGDRAVAVLRQHRV
jgi:3-oxoacyl-[acyl-carrier-protein] synthase-1